MNESIPQLKIHLTEGKTIYVKGKDSVQEVVFNFTYNIKENKLITLQDTERNHIVYINPNHIIRMEEFESQNRGGLTILK